MPKYVKDEARNRYEAYCCEDIDARVGALEAAVEALVAGTVPDGAVTLSKLSNDARMWRREANKGLLFAEWIGTQDEYNNHIALNGGEPQANVRYTIVDAPPQPQPTPQWLNDYEILKLTSAGYYIINYYIYAYETICYSTGVVFWDGSSLTRLPSIFDRETKYYFSPAVYADGTFGLYRNGSDTGTQYPERVAVVKIV